LYFCTRNPKPHGHDGEASFSVVFETVYCDGKEVRHLPAHKNEKERKGGCVERARDGCVPDHGGNGARQGADDGAVHAAAFKRCIKSDIYHDTEKGNGEREEVSEKEKGRASDYEKDCSKPQCTSYRDTTRGDCASFRTLHPQVYVAIEDVIHDARSGNDRRKTDEHCCH
jgi:hypothetical protein